MSFGIRYQDERSPMPTVWVPHLSSWLFQRQEHETPCILCLLEPLLLTPAVYEGETGLPWSFYHKGVWLSHCGRTILRGQGGKNLQSMASQALAPAARLRFEVPQSTASDRARKPLGSRDPVRVQAHVPAACRSAAVAISHQHRP